MAQKPRALISACLLGVQCRYDGGKKAVSDLDRLMEHFELIPVCPEQLGGLPTPRLPSEQRDSRVYARDGSDVTDAFRRGARQVCQIAELFEVKLAILKARSPSCGKSQVYDGSFSGRLIPGSGVAAHMLADQGVPVYTEEEIDKLLFELEGETHDTI